MPINSLIHATSARIHLGRANPRSLGHSQYKSLETCYGPPQQYLHRLTASTTMSTDLVKVSNAVSDANTGKDFTQDSWMT
jgi:hypothetical protein